MIQSLLSLALVATAAIAARTEYAFHAGCDPTASWLGWFAIKHAFIFGDSYTTTGFSISSTQPTVSNPLGNPTYPGHTSSNGPNWVDFLTTKYNSSHLLTYNLAYGGATVDSGLVQPYDPTVLSLSNQILQEFIPKYAQSTWRAADTLFGIFIGINDVGGSYQRGIPATILLNDKIFAVYKSLVDKLYAAGARNFVFLNVPPVDRSPSTAGQGKDSQALERADIGAFNDAIMAMAQQVKSQHPKCNVFAVDTNQLFTEVLDEPSKFEQTAGYKNTTAFCAAYQNGTPEEDTFIPICGVPVNEYFWLNGLHPTYPVHDVLAQKVAVVLRGGPNVC